MIEETGPVVDSANLLTDNPELYEAQFPDPEHLAGRFVADLVERYAPPAPAGRRLLDVGCGTGRDAGYLAGLGWAVTGLDISPRMLAYARQRHPDVRFVEADLRDFALPARFDVVTCLDSALLYCHGNADLNAFLDRCHAHLRPGGLLVAEMRNGAYFLGGGGAELLDGVRTRTVRWRGTPYTSHTLLWLDHAEQLLRRRRTWTWPGCPDPLVQTSAWRLLFPMELRHRLDTAGFDVLALFDTPGPRTDPPWRADAALGGGLTGDRLHLVARRRAENVPC
ncbi:class I SAM-dependent methyltransferase [Micromonospora rosaria]|uniref:class I SAM-dependent methyltransferase n=1 Tax=Micromonospora rosaria TaxID=47874 RepID=UPI0009FD9241|nr:class I SAM-dependent methyltransferase [Micromonospora rosaria]